MYCKKCGTKVNDDALFCSKCGERISRDASSVFQDSSSEETNKSEREIRIEGRINKCPVCGEILKSGDFICPSCGYEIQGRKSVSSVQEFMNKISRIQDENEKIQAIKLFPIPNDKESIREFTVLASINLDVRLYITSRNRESEAEAWMTQIEQCYKKARIFFRDTEDFVMIDSIYKEIKQAIFKSYLNKFVFIVLGAVLLIVGLVLICALGPNEKSSNGSYGVGSYIGLASFFIGIVLIVIGVKRKRTVKEIEQNKIDKMNRRNNKN